MEQKKLCESDYKFMTFVWDNQYIKYRKLVKLCADGGLVSIQVCARFVEGEINLLLEVAVYELSTVEAFDV